LKFTDSLSGVYCEQFVFCDMIKLQVCQTLQLINSTGLLIQTSMQLTYRQTCWNDVRCPTKWRESPLRQPLQVRVSSDSQKIQSLDWPKWRCALWRNVSFRIFVGHRLSFQVVCRNVHLESIWFIQTSIFAGNVNYGIVRVATSDVTVHTGQVDVFVGPTVFEGRSLGNLK